jgi:sec-independent protein translocase protein TatB
VFDIAFSEIALIAVVALVVIGPERLPKVARTLGHMFGRLQRYVNEVKADINREIELDELRKLKSEVQSAALDIERSVSQTASEVESGVRSVEAELNSAASEASSVSSASADPAPSADAPPHPTAVVARDLAPKADAEGPRQSTLPGLERI